jgi:hypothetical protein
VLRRAAWQVPWASVLSAHRLEAVVTPTPLLDIGARFFLDGFVGESGGVSPGFNYFDLRALMVWFRIHT